MDEIIKAIRQKAKNCYSNTKEGRARKGAYVDCIGIIQEYLNKTDGGKPTPGRKQVS
jgi:hypothetical protein